MSLVKNLDNIFDKDDIGRVRKAQEDSHDMALKTPNGDVFVVCDGMGGHVGGAKASSLAVENIIEHLKSEKYEDPFVALEGALKRANDQIMGFAQANPEYKGMGTTACVLILQNDGAYLAHVGDSRIYLYHGKEKTLNRITKDHSYVQALVDAEQITEEEAEHHINKNRILKALGVVPSTNLEPSFNSGHPKVGDIFLICSDGLSGMIPDSTIEQVLLQNSTVEEKGELLINLAMQGETIRPGGQDNCTVELIQIDNDPWPMDNERGFKYYNPKKSEKKADKTNDKKAISKIVKIIAVIVALIVVLGGVGVYVNLNQKKKTIKEEIKTIDEQLETIDGDISGKALKKSECETKKTKAEGDLKKGIDKETAQNRVKDLQNEINKLDGEISNLELKKDSLSNKKIELENKLKKTHSNESNNNRKK